MQTSNKMAVAPVGKLIWQMSIPPLISMFLQYSYNLIDSAFVARLSENALTAVSLSFPITTLMNAASIWIGVGVNVLIAGYLGQKKQDEANTTVTHGLLLAFGNSWAAVCQILVCYFIAHEHSVNALNIKLSSMP